MDIPNFVDGIVHSYSLKDDKELIIEVSLNKHSKITVIDHKANKDISIELKSRKLENIFFDISGSIMAAEEIIKNRR